MTLRRILPVILVIAACAAVAWVWLRPGPAGPSGTPAPKPGTPAPASPDETPADPRADLPDLTLAVLSTCEDRLVPAPCSRIQGGSLMAMGPFLEETQEYTATMGVFMGDASLAPGPLGKAQLRLVHAFVLPYTAVKIVSAGEGELAHGVDYVRTALSEMSRISGKALLAANATDAAGHALLSGYNIARYVAEPPKPQIPRHVLFVGVVAESVQRRLAERGSDIVFSPAAEAVRSAYAKGVAQAEEVGYPVHDTVLLVQGTVDEAVAILADAPEFTVAIASRGPLLPELEPRMAGSTPVFYAGRGLRFAWRVFLSESADEPVQGFLVRLGPALDQRKSAYAEIVIEHMTKLGALDLEQAVAAKARPPHPDGDFVGAASCKECHAEEFAQHAQSAHTFRVVFEGAVSTACVGCHATGTEYATGWPGLDDESDLVSVSCEACHGPASEHLAEPKAPYGAVALDDCRRCHLPDRSPAFDAEGLWEQHGHAAPRTRKR